MYFYGILKNYICAMIVCFVYEFLINVIVRLG